MNNASFTTAVLVLCGLAACGGQSDSAQGGASLADAADDAIPDGFPEAGADASETSTVPDSAPDAAPGTVSTLWRNAIRCDSCYPYDLASDSTGGVFVAGIALGPVSDFGDGQYHDASWDGFLARYHADGTLDWARVLPGEVSNRITTVVVGPDDRVVVLGSMQGSTDLGAGVIPVAATSAFIARYDVDGALMWAHIPDPAEIRRVASVALDAAGGVVAVGSFDNHFDCHGFASSNGTSGSYVLRLDAGGSPSSCKVIGEGESFDAGLVQASDDGETWVAGRCRGGSDLGGGPLGVGTFGGPCVLKLDAAGEYAWSWLGVTSDWPMGPYAMSVDSNGSAYLTGVFQATLTVGSVVLESPGDLNLGTYAMRLDATGAPAWARRIASRSSMEPGDTPDPRRCDVASDGQGGAVFAGTFYGDDADFGGAPLPAKPNATVYVGRLDVNGNHVWSRAYGADEGRQQGSAVALRPDGSIALAGYFNVSIDFEPLLLGDSDGLEDGFVAALAPE